MSILATRADVAGTPSNATAKAGITSIYDFVAQRLAAGTAGAGTATLAELVTARDSLQLASAKADSLWINSDFRVNQRGLTSVADAAYALDCTYVLTESGSLTVAKLNQPTDGIPSVMRLTQPDAGAKRMGAAQVVEAAQSWAYRGAQVVFAPKLRCSAAATLRVAILSWAGTADVVTRDVVNSWSNATFTPGNFFNTTSLTVVATGSVACAANTWTDVPVSSASAGGVVVPSSCNNLILMYWTEATAAQNVTLDASIMRAGAGTSIPVWQQPEPALELARCQRRYWKAQTTSGAGQFPRLLSYQAAGAGQVFIYKTPVTMRSVPSVTVLTGAGWSLTNCSAPVNATTTTENIELYSTATALGSMDAYPGSGNSGFEASADL